MSEPVKIKVQVLKAKYIESVDSIALIGLCDKGEIKHQIHSSCFDFGGRNKVQEMVKTAKIMEGKPIWLVFDPDLEGKMQDHYPLRYK